MNVTVVVMIYTIVFMVFCCAAAHLEGPETLFGIPNILKWEQDMTVYCYTANKKLQ